MVNNAAQKRPAAPANSTRAAAKKARVESVQADDAEDPSSDVVVRKEADAANVPSPAKRYPTPTSGKATPAQDVEASHEATQASDDAAPTATEKDTSISKGDGVTISADAPAVKKIKHDGIDEEASKSVKAVENAQTKSAVVKSAASAKGDAKRPRPNAWKPKPEKEAPLKEALGCTDDRYLGRLARVSVTSMEAAIPEDDSVVSRLEAMIESPGAFPSAINLCTVEPSRLNKKVGRQLMTDASPHKHTIFFLIGTLTHDALDLMEGQLTKHVCLAPFTNGFGRALSVLRSVYNAPYFLFSSYKGGITFSTGRFAALPGEKSIRFRPVLNKEADVPIYDARNKPFKWSSYKKLPIYKRDGQIDTGTVCAVLFTIGSYTPSSKSKLASYNPEVVKHAMSFNLQSLIVLESPDPNAKSYAVNAIHELSYDGIIRDPSLTLAKAMNVEAAVGSPEPEDDPNEKEV